MFRIPKLPCPPVRNSRQRAPAWRPPIGRKDWLPDNQHAHVAVRVLRKDLLGCGRPPQASRSSRGQQQYHPQGLGIAIKGGGEFAQIRIRKHDERPLACGHRGWSPEIHDSQERSKRHHHENDCSPLHLQNRFAMTPAISCGNRIIPTTTITAAQSNTWPTHLPRRAHCLARCCCQNPRPSSTTDSPKSHGRSVVKKALAAVAPRAAANPSGRQQLIVAMELRIAASEAEMPVPCFTICPLAGLRSKRSESFPPAADRRASIRDTNGNSVRSFLPCAFLPLRPVH